MGTQTMGSQGCVGDTSIPKPPGLSRQGSLYSLTLDEVENHLGNLGKPLGSLNLDELLRTVEATQTIGGSNNVHNGAQNLSQGSSGVSALSRQSSILLSRDLKEKTVEEVWREIQEGAKSTSEEQDPERQNTLGEMTLEDFLVQAGVVIDAPDGGGGNSNGNSNVGAVVDPNSGQHAPWMPYQLIPQQQQHGMMTMFMPGHAVPQPISVSGGTLSDTGYTDAQLAVTTSPLMGTLSDPQTVGRKRIAPGNVVERTVERRQKRMIKNRESAARSRARKQAYTHELENKVSRLEEENERLRRMREVEKALPSVPPPQPKYQLRRTSSAPI
ncbi:ABSCISIC ACID-INSENSITIVE 5-like protein 2 [Silene latifolia]|uniref:ABSCISIC ACID-INSENSITIVE 5-like protein 2 n=1 Tax=Silene latifolia TaxID=37657 RepID=UPI003D770E98